MNEFEENGFEDKNDFLNQLASNVSGKNKKLKNSILALAKNLEDDPDFDDIISECFSKKKK